jgi:hypothetical protein
MLWGPGQSDDFVSESEAGWTDTLLTPKKEILAFNEPNLRDQASMEPDAAARIWIRDLEPLRAKGFRLGAPVTTSAPDGVTWMKVSRGMTSGLVARHMSGADLHFLFPSPS